MKVRESGMPERDTWEGFFNPAEILKVMKLDKNVSDVVEFGCGYGTFTIPAARIVKGTVYAIDIDPDMVELTQEAAQRERLNNVQTILRDFIENGTGIDNESVNYVMLFNILHLENPQRLLREAWSNLRYGGMVGIIHWNYDLKTPRGPSMDIRPKPEQCIQWAESVGFRNPVQYDLKPHHYGIVLTKKEATK